MNENFVSFFRKNDSKEELVVQTETSLSHTVGANIEVLKSKENVLHCL